MDENEIVSQIDKLIEQEHALQRGHANDAITAGEQARLRDIEVQLDQCWDLLRRRRARRAAGLDPSEEDSVRGADVVEGYEQ
jgi:hypothetical protein